jgi:hypothetical protein
MKIARQLQLQFSFNPKMQSPAIAAKPSSPSPRIGF